MMSRAIQLGARRQVAAMLAAALLGLAFALLAPGPAAFAGGSLDDVGGSDTTSGSTEVVNRCVLYANASSFGADCAGGSSGLTVKDVLDGEKFPECRHDPIPGDVSPPSTHDGEEGAWYLKTCLEGIKKDGGGDFTRTTELVWFPDGEGVPGLSVNQRRAWSFFRSTYPSPVPQFGPASQPRVLIPTFFWLTDSTGRTISHTVFDGTRDVLMQARVDQIEVTPGRYDDERPFVCTGPIRPYDHSRGIYNQVSNCSYEYDRSSAFTADRNFDVTVQADWVVEYQRPDGTWRQLGRFPLGNVFETPVDEIQTVVD